MRFNDFREIQARFDSTSTDCGKGGHPIKKGEFIGYGRKRTVCADCWRKWCAENAEANLYESNLSEYGY